MKSLFYINLAFQLLYLGIANAQIALPNPGFEEWDSIPGTRPYWEPKYYNSKCGAFQNENRIYIFKSTEKHTGNYSLLITPAIDSVGISFSNNNSWLELDTFKNRQISDSSEPRFFSLPLTGIPIKITGWYKFIPDTSTFFPSIIFSPGMALYTGIENMGTTSLCGVASMVFLEPKSEFTYFSVPVNDECPPFTPTLYALLINFPSKNKLMNPAGKLWLDDLEIEYETTSVDGRKKNSFVVFPNPGSDAIKVSGLTGSEKISLQNSHGKILLEKQTHSEPEIQLETMGLPPGMYFLMIERKGQKEVQKWVKQ